MTNLTSQSDRPGYQLVANIADSHVDSRNRWEETLRIDQHIVDELARLRPSLITHSGDLTNRETGIPERRHLTEHVTALAEIAPLVIVKGNHDRFGDLEFLASLRTKHRVIVEQHARVHRIGGFAVAAVAWAEKGNLLAQLPAATAKDETDRLAAEALHQILTNLGNQLHECPEPKILLIHAMVRGSLIGQDQPLIGVPMELPIETLAQVRPDFGVLGHIHLRQCFHYAGVDYVFPGSTHPTNWGERETKGIVLAEFQDGRYLGYHYHDLPATQMLLIEAHFDPTAAFPFIFKGDVPREHLDQLVADAEVRIRYVVAPEYRDVAKRAAEDLKTAWESAGAINVKPEPKQAESTSARLPEIATVRGVREKLSLYWKHLQNEPEPSRATRLLDYACELECEVDANTETNFTGAVRWNYVRAKGLGEFREEINVDFDALGGTLVGLWGTNGAGKSTFAEFLPMAMYRQGPTRGRRGNVGTLANSRDSFLEVGITNGKKLILHHKFDCNTGGSEAAVFDENRKPLWRDTKITTFKKWRDNNLPLKSLFYAGPFAAQKGRHHPTENSGGQTLVDLKPTGRKTLLLRALGIEYYKAMTSIASSRATQAKDIADTARTKLQEIVRGGDPAAAALALHTAEAEAEAANRELENAKADLAALALEITAATDRHRRQQASEERRLGLEAQLMRLTETITDTDKRRSNNVTVLSQRDAINAAVARDQLLPNAIADKRAAEAAAHTVSLRADAEHLSAQSRLTAANAALTAAQQRAKRATYDDTLRASIENAVATLAASEAQLRSDGVELTSLDAFVTQLRATRLTSIEERVTCLRQGLTTIAAGADGPQTIATETLSTDDAAIAATIEFAENLRLSEEKLNETRAAVSTLQSEVVRTRLLAARQSELAAADAERTAAEADAASTLATLDSLTREVETACSNATALKATYEQLSAERTALEHERTTLAQLTKLAPQLAQADTRIAELTLQLERLTPEADTLIGELLLLRPPAPPIDIPSRVAADALVQARSGAVEAAAANVVAARTKLEVANASQDRIAELKSEIAAADELHADWARLTADLGPNGLQAMEISAAEPEFNVLLNDLLERCSGSRWRIRFETTRLSHDGKDEIEDCPIIVTDNEKGREDEIETYSGGERVVLEEAISLALTVLSCQHSGAEGSTLVRDETGPALADEFGPMYITMLRRAAEIIKASKVIFISHSKELQQLADVGLLFDKGTVRVIGAAGEAMLNAA